jgi:hypothetical protein
VSSNRRPEVESEALVEIERRLSVAPAPDFSAAACRDTDVPMQPTTTKGAQEAKAVCGECSCLFACREWALSQPGWLEGVFGGLTQVERERIKADRRRAAGLAKTRKAVAA